MTTPDPATGQRPPKRPWSRTAVAVVLLAAVVFGLTAVVTLKLKHLGEQGVQAERDLQAVATELRTQDALEWRIISGRLAPEDVRAELVQSRERAEVLIQRASASDPGHYTAELLAAHARYGAAVDELLALLAAGQAEEAEEVDETEVDPAFDAVLESLQEEGHEVSAAAARARTWSDAGVLLTVVLSLALTAGVQSRRKRAEVRRDAERQSEARYRALIDQSSDLVLVCDRAGRARYLSPSADRLLRAGPAAPVDLVPLAHPADEAALTGALQHVTAERPVSLELRLQSSAGLRTYELSVQDLTDDPAVGGLVLTGHDITARQALQAEMERRALHDTLTGLPNRALLADRFEQALRSEQHTGSPTGLLLIDLDRFKEINDTLGHHVGDQLLVQIGPRLSGVLRAGDTVARLGGDEFAVLLPEVGTLEAALRIADELQTALAGSFAVVGVDLDVEASIGVVLSREHGHHPAELMQRADIAMYVAKQGSLGVAVYDPDTDGHSPERLALLGDLRRALSNDELVLHYQPKVSLSTGEVCGAEALVRWQHPDRGLVPPDAFIPLAENTGLIGPLTSRVLDLALAQARRWADAGAPLQVAVNLSARNLLDGRIDTVVAQLLARHGVPATLLKLEVTESAIMTDPVRAKTLLDRLAAQGVTLSIDDFGAGYTSLAQLKNLPITEIKVDRSFVQTMQTDTSNSMIVRSVVELGHNLGLTAVAEGVESADILQQLTGYTCDVAQGYHLSRPLTAQAFDTWRTTWPGLPPTPRQHPALPATRTPLG